MSPPLLRIYLEVILNPSLPFPLVYVHLTPSQKIGNVGGRRSPEPGLEEQHCREEEKSKGGGVKMRGIYVLVRWSEAEEEPSPFPGGPPPPPKPCRQPKTCRSPPKTMKITQILYFAGSRAVFRRIFWPPPAVLDRSKTIATKPWLSSVEVHRRRKIAIKCLPKREDRLKRSSFDSSSADQNRLQSVSLAANYKS